MKLTLPIIYFKGDLMEDGECCMEDPCRDGGAEECGPAEGTICTNECKGHTCSCEEGFTMTPTGEDTEECVLVNIKTQN